MSDKEEKNRKEKAIEQIAMEWQKIARTGLGESRDLLFNVFTGYAGELYRNRLGHVLTAMEKTANHLWEGTRL